MYLLLWPTKLESVLHFAVSPSVKDKSSVDQNYNFKMQIFFGGGVIVTHMEDATLYGDVEILCMKLLAWINNSKKFKWINVNYHSTFT